MNVFDSSLGGLGGCPYAPGAAGNLATEDLIYLAEKMGIATGIDLSALCAASAHMADALGRELPGRVFRYRCPVCDSELFGRPDRSFVLFVVGPIPKPVFKIDSKKNASTGDLFWSHRLMGIMIQMITENDGEGRLYL